MIKNYLKVVFRNLLKNLSYAAINIVGLSIGLASFIIIGLYVFNESSYDRFWLDADRIYRMNGSWGSPEGESRYATAPPPLAKVMTDEIPEVRAVTRIFKWGDFTLRPDTDSSKIFRETNIYLADAQYFNVFGDRLLQGDPATALVEPLSIVISEAAAIRYFGKQFYEENNMVGRLLLGGNSATTQWKITAVMKDLPLNSHQQFEILIASSVFGGDFDNGSNWTWNLMHTYALMHKPLGTGADFKAVQDKLDDIVRQHALPYMSGGAEEYLREGNFMKYYLQPLTDIHLHSSYLREMRPNGDITYVYIFSAVAILVLLVACINFINLSIAFASKRAKEVGMRKVMGSHNRQLVLQFLTESVLYSFLAMLVALGVVELFNMLLADAFQLRFVYGLFDKALFIVALLVLVVGVGVVAGLYPAIYLTSFRPREVIDYKLAGHGWFNLRNVLVIFQLVVSSTLIIATGTVSDQLDFIRSTNLGFEKENVLIIHNDREIRRDRELFKNTLTNYDEILTASFSTGVPAMEQFRIRDYTLEGEEAGFGFRWHEIDADYLNALNMEIVAGRSFSKSIASDSMGLILNERAVLELGLEEAIGKYIVINQGANDERKVRVVGVVKDFNFESFHKEIKPLGMEFLRGYTFKDYITVRIAKGKAQEAVEIIKKEWSRFQPDVPVTYTFLDEDFDQLFRAEQQLGKLFNLFTSLAIIIASIGLLGLAAYATESRRKEIGIRKVLGASIANVLWMLSSNFARLTLIGFVLAAPIAYILMDKWLQGFVYKTAMAWQVFALGAGISLAITLFAVLYQTLKASVENPVHALKEE